jgi:hypothetical protein
LPFAVTVRVVVAELPEDNDTLLWERLVLSRPVDDDDDRVTFPANSLRLVREIVDVAELPWVRLRAEGLAEIPKSPVVVEVTVRERLVAWDSEPLVPMTVTV